MTERIQRLVMHAFRGVPGRDGRRLRSRAKASRSTATTVPARARSPTRSSGTSRARSSSCVTKGASMRCATWAATRDGVTSVEVVTNGSFGGKVVFPDERAIETLQATPARDVPPPRPHARRLHQQDQDRKVEGAGRDSRPGRDREPSRGPATRAKRPAQGSQVGRRRGPIVPPRVGLGSRGGHARDACSPVFSRSARCWGRCAAVARRGGRPVVDRGRGRRQRDRCGAVRRARACSSRSDARRPGVRQARIRKPGTRWCLRTGRGGCRGPRWCARQSGSSRPAIERGRCPLCGQKVDE